MSCAALLQPASQTGTPLQTEAAPAIETSEHGASSTPGQPCQEITGPGSFSAARLLAGTSFSFPSTCTRAQTCAFLFVLTQHSPDWSPHLRSPFFS